jgi:hypothetical protein
LYSNLYIRNPTGIEKPAYTRDKKKLPIAGPDPDTTKTERTAIMFHK